MPVTSSGPAPPRHNVLVVEDDPSIRTLLTSALHAAGYAVNTADTGQTAMFEAGRGQPDLILLDVGLPDIDGFAVTRHLRAEGVYTPVLFLTARTDVEDRIIGLSSGGDDYVTKPFHVQEVLLRIRAILRRSDMPPGTGARRPPLRYADLVLDEQSHEVWRAGLPIQLSPTEFRLLVCLLAQPERVVGKKEILSEVWHYDFAGDARIVDTYVRNLRRKIDRFEPQLIQTIRGVGYRLRASRPGSGTAAL